RGEGEAATGAGGSFRAALAALDGRRLATGRDFTEAGELSEPGRARLDEAGARGLVDRLEDAEFGVTSVEEKPYRRSPYPPFMTSTMQQEAGRKLRFSSQRTMSVAQRLYESGWITYMRTDSTALSETALDAARAQARQLYGDAYVPERPRRYERKVKNAQESHEAIRPAGDSWRTPDQASGQLGADERRLYELVWKRTVASQMADARGTSAQVRLVGRMGSGGSSPLSGSFGPGSAPAGGPGPLRPPEPGRDEGDRAWASAAEAELAASGKVITFPGFLRAYVEGADDPEAALEDQEAHLPSLAAGDPLDAEDLAAEGHATQPPSRYTEASLVKAMEELGVGRPSTYASIIGTIQDRGYVWKRGSALIPSFTAFAVVTLLERHFADLVDYGFTASMEDDLDEIAGGGEEAVPWLTRFYFGDGRPGLKAVVADNLGEIDAREVNSIPVGTDGEGRPVVVRVGRYGPYVQRGEERASLPDDLAPDELTMDRVEELLSATAEERVLGDDPETGLPVVLRAGRFGPYVQLGEAGAGPGGDGGDGSDAGAGGSPGRARGSGGKPPTASLFGSMAPDTVTLEDALRVLSLPRVVGTDPADGEEITALNGRYGPYLRKGGDSRSLAEEEQLFSVTLDEALALFAAPKPGRGRRAAAPPLRELGPDPVSGGAMVVKEGRFGPYVTDGEVNASLRRGDTVEGLTAERATELLADRRAKAAAGGTGKKGGSGSGRGRP
ncbi:MAG: DNA topoisomerase, partial [Acidimicrobiales bacterium]